MENIDIIKVAPEESIKLERLENEMNARKFLLAYLIENKIDYKNNLQFDKYQNEYVEYLQEFNRAKSELEEKYIIPIKKTDRYTWRLTYKTCELKVIYSD